jgi:hypothetical protein
MTLGKLSLAGKWLNQLLGSFSVHTRLIVLALVPVAGFVANGLS